MTWFENFFQDRNDLFLKIKSFDDNYKFGLIEKLKREKIKVDFLSTITEIQFGLFFDKIAEDLKYNFPAFNQSSLKPDWTISMNGQKIIAEVLRINATDSDQKFLDFDMELINRLEQIQ